MATSSAQPPAAHTAAGAPNSSAVGGAASAAAASPDDAALIIIRGETLQGKKFRPSDWCDRLYGALRALGDDGMADAIEFVHIISYKGANCIVVDSALQQHNPQVYQFYLNFAKNNQLQKQGITRAYWSALNTHTYPQR